MQKKHKHIIENIFSLGAINGINLLIPLITLPYLIRILGIDNYGAYSIVYAMLQYGILFSGYGFGFSVTQQIAQNRENRQKISQIVSATIFARFLIMIAVSVIMILICLTVYPHEYLIMFLCGLGVLIGDILNPTWLYQGMETMRFMTLINLVSKTTFTLLIFVFIKQKTDYPYVTFLNSIGYVVAGCLSLILAYRNFRLKFFVPRRSHVIDQFKSGWYIFLSTLSMNLYRNSNIFILGFFLPSGLVGIYSGAEKVIKAFQAIISPISNALFPYVARSFKSQKKNEQWLSVRKMCLYMGVLLLLLSIVAYLSAPITNEILLDNLGKSAIILIRLMSPVIFFGGLNYILGIVGLFNSGEKKSFFHCVMVSGIASLMILLLLVKYMGIFSAGISMTISELTLFIMCLWKWRSITRTNKFVYKW